MFMGKKFPKIFLLFAIIATFAGGCKSTTDYKNFADAGNKFIAANDDLLKTAENLQVDSTSEEVLNQRMLLPPTLNKKVSNNFVQDYRNLSDADKKRLKLIQDLRIHNQLLQDYFQKIIELANSSSPADTTESVSNIASDLQKTGAKLNPTIVNQVPPVTKIVLDNRISGALRQELENHKDMIYQEITIQQYALRSLGYSMENDVDTIRNLQEYRLVLQPLVSDKFDPDGWVTTRNKVMTQNDELRLQIDKASQSLNNFKEMFVAIVGGKMNSKSLKNFIKETNSFSQSVMKKNKEQATEKTK